MTDADWESFIYSSAAVGTAVRIEVSAEERAIWPRLPVEIDGVPVVHFDCSIANGAVGIVRRASFCGWLRVEIPDHGEIDVPGWYLRQAESV